MFDNHQDGNPDCKCPCYERGFFDGVQKGKLDGKYKGLEAASKILANTIFAAVCDEHYEISCRRCEEGVE